MDPTPNKVEEGVDHLLEDGWFFGNFLNGRNGMLRCYSDPCPSSNMNQDHVLVVNSIDDNNNSSSSTSKKMVTNDGQHSLIRAPSLPSWIGRENTTTKMSKLTRKASHERATQASSSSIMKKERIKESEGRVSKLSGKSSLLRTPSLPPWIGRKEVVVEEEEEEEEEIHDDESYARLSNLIRQALPNTSEILPPKRPSKCMMHSSSVPRNLEMQTNYNDTTIAKETRPRYNQNQRKLWRSSTELEFEELQGFKDLGFTFDKDDLTPSVVNILPGLQDKKQQQQEEEEEEEEDSKQVKMRRPYLSEAWHMQQMQGCSSSPPIPDCVTNPSSAEDMKAQIKFWARAVASNVR